LVTEELKFGALGQQQERDLIKLVSKSDCEGLEKRLVDSVRDRSSIELISLPLHPDFSGRLDQIIDGSITELPQRSATPSRMRDRGNGIEQVDFALQMNLYDFPVLGCARKVVGSAFVEEDMQYDLIKCRVLRVPVVLPIRNVHIPLYIASEYLFPIYADSRVNEIGAGLAVPESELDNLNKGSGGRVESSSEGPGVPKGLPFEFGPFFGEITGWVGFLWRFTDARLLVD
jgi:hypothetical protein